MIDRAYIEKRMGRLSEIETELGNPSVSANQKKFRELLREHAALKKIKEKADKFILMENEMLEYRGLTAPETADAELREMAKAEMADLEKALPVAERELLVTLLPPDPSDTRNAIMEIRAGTGGDEAALFAADLFRMYSHFAERKGWRIGMIDASTSEIGGYKEVVFSLEGQDVYRALKYESGGHRVQRIPETEGSGRIHTSAATVAVFPEADQDDDIEIKPEEIRIDLFCSSGPGGQSVNTTYSAVRITHLPTGLVVQSQDERSQKRNKDKAMAVIKARILDLKRREEEEKRGNFRRMQIGSGDRSERIRTYNFPQNRLTDHRINFTLYSLDKVIDGDLDELLRTLIEHDVQLRLEAEMKSIGVAIKEKA